MKKSIISITICFLSMFNLVAQDEGTDNTVGKNYVIDSKILEEKRQIQVFLPPEYTKTDKKYPVLYILDGQRFFLYGVSLHQSFSHFGLTPEFIVVGINNSYPERFRHFGSGKVQFMNFIEKELKPFINNTFRTENENIFFGWEYGGSLVFHTMLSKAKLFDAYILASPFPIEESVMQLDSIDKLNKNLYFSVSPDEYAVKHGVVKLDSLLSVKPIEDLNWSYLKLDIEKHRSTGYPTLYHGLRNYFKYYQEFEVNNLQKFIEAGGIKYAHQYNDERAHRHGFSSNLSLWSRYTIVRSAFRAEDYNYFTKFMEAFNSEEFIDELIKGNMDYGATFIADFYKKNKDYNKALQIYELLLKKHPNSERLKNKIESVKKSK